MERLFDIDSEPDDEGAGEKLAVGADESTEEAVEVFPIAADESVGEEAAGEWSSRAEELAVGGSDGERTAEEYELTDENAEEDGPVEAPADEEARGDWLSEAEALTGEDAEGESPAAADEPAGEYLLRKGWLTEEEEPADAGVREDWPTQAGEPAGEDAEEVWFSGDDEQENRDAEGDSSLQADEPEKHDFETGFPLAAGEPAGNEAEEDWFLEVEEPAEKVAQEDGSLEAEPAGEAVDGDWLLGEDDLTDLDYEEEDPYEAAPKKTYKKTSEEKYAASIPGRLAAYIGAHKQQTALVGVGVCVLLAGTLLVSAFVGGKGGDAASRVPLQAMGPVSSKPPQNGPQEDTDPIVPTVLPKTEDAGAEYVKETLFLGDSNTERMLYYADVTGVTVDNGFGVVGMDISSFATTECARFAGVEDALTMPKVVELLQPRRVVMSFGTNNVGMQLDRFIQDYKAALDLVKQASPASDIIVGGVFPVDQYRQNTAITMERINQMNEALTALCEAEGVKFLNWGEAVLDEATGFSAFESTIQDGVHLSRAGMTAVIQYFRTHSYVTKDRRPTPLAAAPKRIATPPAIIAQDEPKKAGPIDWDALDDAKKPVVISLTTWDETNNTAGGGSVSPGTVSVKPGGTSAAVTATPGEGYTFVGWAFASGTTGGGGATTFITVNSAVEPGATLSVTAVFRRTDVPASSQPNTASSQDTASSSSGAGAPSSVAGSSSSSGAVAPSSSRPRPSSSSRPASSSSSVAPSQSSQAPSSSQPVSSVSSNPEPSSESTPAPSVPDPSSEVPSVPSTPEPEPDSSQLGGDPSVPSDP